MKNIYIILGIVVLVMVGVVWKSNSDRKAREEALALQTQQYNQKMAQLEAENQARLAQEAKDKAQKEQARIESNKQAKIEQANFDKDHQVVSNQATVEKKAEDDKPDKIKEIENKVKELAFDPDSAKFRNQKGNCGEVNAKNRFGGYTGFKMYIYDDKTDMVTIEDLDKFYDHGMMKILWDARCPN